jgi:formylglycine-generating enzyme required for sulfatase activity
LRTALLLLALAGCGRWNFAQADADEADADVGAIDTTSAAVFPSCAAQAPGADHACGFGGVEDCCGSFAIPAQSFMRDGNGGYPATISSFRLDAYLVTVGRFRSFVDAVAAGWRPADGAGKHTHVNGGMGLVNSGADGGFEDGWQSAWNAFLPTTFGDWDTQLMHAAGMTTWTSTPGAYENYPIGVLQWYQAYAFCIWDGGFLPSEAEWNDAAQGGDANNPYPWGTAPLDASLSVYNDVYTGPVNRLPVGSLPAGNARWGQSDLSGEAWEWTLDGWAAPYATAGCDDCADLAPPRDERSIRGGCSSCSGNGGKMGGQSHGTSNPEEAENENNGVRCARAP